MNTSPRVDVVVASPKVRLPDVQPIDSPKPRPVDEQPTPKRPRRR